MEPTINKQKDQKKIIIIIVILLIVIGVMILLRSKTEAPTNTYNKQLTSEQESKQLESDINSITTFDNESSLSQIDKEF